MDLQALLLRNPASRGIIRQQPVGSDLDRQGQCFGLSWIQETRKEPARRLGRREFFQSRQSYPVRLFFSPEAIEADQLSMDRRWDSDLPG